MTVEECRSKGRNLFRVFHAREERVVMNPRNAEEKFQLGLIVRELRRWIGETREHDLLDEFSGEIKLLLAHIQAEERARADAAMAGERDFMLVHFLESGRDLSVPSLPKPVQHGDYDPERCLYPRA